MKPGEGETLVNRIAPITNEGNAGHDYLARLRRGESPSLDDVCEQHGVSAASLGGPLENAAALWEKIAQWFPCPTVEAGFQAALSQEVLLTGHTDLRSIGEQEEAAVLDHKFGWITDQGTCYDQMKGYALLCYLDGGGRIDHIRVFVGWYREGTVQSWEWTADELLDFQDSIVSTVLDARADDLHPGPHCTYCPRRHSCPALMQELRGTTHMLMELGNGGELSPASLHSAFRNLTKVENAIRLFRSSLRERIETGGPIVCGDQQITLKTVVKKPITDTERAWPVITARLSEAEAVKCVTITKGALDDAVAKKAGAGKGAKAKRELTKELEAAGALSERPERHFVLENVNGTER